MPEYFDSTVAVSAIFPGSTNYADASARLKAAGDGAYIINHGVAEVFRTLTGRLKLPCLSGWLPSRDSAHVFPFVYDGADSKVLAFGNETDRQ